VTLQLRKATSTPDGAPVPEEVTLVHVETPPEVPNVAIVTAGPQVIDALPAAAVPL